MKAPKSTIEERDRLTRKLMAEGVDYDSARFAAMTAGKSGSGMLSEQPKSEKVRNVIDDFFGDGRTAEPECTFCGGNHDTEQNPLEVTIRDNYGPTHWMHKQCRPAYEKERQSKIKTALPDYDADTAIDGVE